MHSKDLARFAEQVLDDMKAKEIRVLDVSGLTSITDYMIIATGTSGRHVRSVAERLVENCKQADRPLLGIEGMEEGNWVLVHAGFALNVIDEKDARETWQWLEETEMVDSIPEELKGTGDERTENGNVS